jgi:PAS domain S-box-containing protein
MLRTIVDTEPECVKVVAPGGLLLDMNPAGLAMIEADDLEQVKGKSIYPIVAETHRETFVTLTESVFHGESGTLEFEIVGLKGTRRRLETHAVPLRDESGAIFAMLGLTRDITVRTQAEQSMRRTASLLQATLDSTADGILVVDSDGKISAFNRRFVEMWEIPQEVIDSRDDDQALAFVLGQLSDPDGFMAKVRELYAHPLEESFDILGFKDDRVFERYSAAQILDGRPVGRVWSFRDITRATQVERERRNAEGKYRDLVERIPAVVYLALYGEGAPWLYVSPRIETMLGYSPDDWIENPELWFQRLHSADRDRVMEEENRSRDSGEPFVSEYRFVAKDGHAVWVRDEAEVVRDERGAPVALRGLWYDITDRKEAEEALRDAERRFRAIVEHVPAAIYLDVPDGTMATTYVSPQIEQIMGVTPEEYIATPDLWLNLMPDAEQRDQMRTTYVEAVQERRSWQGEYRIRKPEGSEVSIRDQTAFIADENGEPLFLLGLMYDITDRVRTDEALRESEELVRRLYARLLDAQEAERARIAQDIHDDSIQVVTAVGLRIQTLRRAITDPKAVEQIEKLQVTVESAIVRLRNLLFELRPRALDEEGLASALRLYLDQIEGQSELRYRVDNRLVGEPPPEVRTVLFRIAQEAIVNVRKHANATQVELLIEPRDKGFHVRVSDDGEGFDEAGAGSSEPGHLGLSSMRERAEMAHGWLKVESAPGRGTVVDLWLPEHA